MPIKFSKAVLDKVIAVKNKGPASGPTQWAVTAVGLNPRTFQIEPMANGAMVRTEIVDTEKWGFPVLTDPRQVAQSYEAFWNEMNDHPPTIVKVIDVRPYDKRTEFELKELR